MASTTLTSNIYMAIILYMTFDRIICTILFGLLELPKIALFKDFIMKIIEVKVTEKSKKSHFPRFWPKLFPRLDL